MKAASTESNATALAPIVSQLVHARIHVSLFIDADERQVRAAVALKPPVVDLYTGQYAEAEGNERNEQLGRLAKAAAATRTLGIECHAGDGLTFENVRNVAAIPEVVELNIGHFLVEEALYQALAGAIAEMQGLIRAGAMQSSR